MSEELSQALKDIDKLGWKSMGESWLRKDESCLKNEQPGSPQSADREAVKGSPTPENDALISKYARFVPVAQAIAAMSKQPGTKVGAIVLGQDFEQLASGWNGAPRGCRAEHDERISTRELRLAWVCHAEANAVANAARAGTSLRASTMIVTLMPCMACAKLMVQAGVVRVLCPEPTVDNDRWGDEFKLSRALFDECSVALHHYETTP